MIKSIIISILFLIPAFIVSGALILLLLEINYAPDPGREVGITLWGIWLLLVGYYFSRSRFVWGGAVLLVFAVAGLIVKNESSSTDNIEGNSKKVTTIIKEKVFGCGSYFLKITKEQFPFIAGMNLPEQYSIASYLGADVAVTEKAYYVSDATVELPLPREVNDKLANLLEETMYLPSDAACLGNRFVVYYGSGGNCTRCVTFLEFDVKEGAPANPRYISYSEYMKFRNDYKKTHTSEEAYTGSRNE